MKKIFVPLFIITALALCFIGCDKIEEPFIDPQSPLIGSKKVLVEDYTGHTCGNCPEAARAAEELKQLFDTQVVVISVHAGFFAKPKPLKYTTDFNTDAGTAWDTDFGISNAGNPNGMVDRIDYASGKHIKAYSEWRGHVQKQIAKKQEVSLTVKTNYDTLSRSLTAEVNLMYFTTPNAEWKLVMCLTEDSIVNYQKDYSKPSGQQDISNYVHRHVLRTTLNDKYGDGLSNVGLAAGTKQTRKYTISLNSEWNYKHCAVVAFIYNVDTKEVIQVQEKHISH